jgi:hypothetical protein
MATNIRESLGRAPDRITVPRDDELGAYRPVPVEA